MTLEQRVYEPEIRDYMTDAIEPEFIVEPGAYYPITMSEEVPEFVKEHMENVGSWAVANYGDSDIKISVQIYNGRGLIGVHP